MDHRVTQPESLMLPLPDDLMQIMSRPAPVIAHPAWRDARAKVLDLVQRRSHLVAILGPAGSGKTTLLRDLAEALQQTRPVTAFSEFSDNSYEFPRNGVVLVDEAERLNRESLDLLARKTAVTVILTALPSFYGRFMEFRDGAVVPLPPLTDEEAMAFLGEWMADFGLALGCVTPDAWERLIAHCHGVPRLLASLLKLALFVGADEASPRVMLEHVKTAIAVQGGGAETNLAEMAGLSPEEAPHDSDGEAAALPRSDLDIPPPAPAPIGYQAASTSRADGSLADETPDGRQGPERRRRIAGWVTAGAICLAGIGLVLWWNRQSLLNNRILLAQDTPVEAPDSAVARERPGPSTPVPTAPAEIHATPTSSAARPIDTNQIAVPAAPTSRSAATTPSLPASASDGSPETKASPATVPATTADIPPPSPAPVTSAAPANAPEGAPPAQTVGNGQTSAASSAVPAIAPAAAAGMTLPSGASIRIVVTYPWGDDAALQRSLDVSRILRAGGFTVLDPFPVPPKRAKKGIRYYFVQDEDVADTIVHRLNGDYGTATLVRFSTIEGLPRPGTIEVDVPHE